MSCERRPHRRAFVPTLAARNPAYRELTRAWMRRSRHLLEQHFDADTARQLDALIEGLALHRALDTAPHDRALTRRAVTRITTTAAAEPAPTPAARGDAA